MKHVLYVSTTLPSPGMGSSRTVYKHLERLNCKISIVSHNNDLPTPWEVVVIPEKTFFLSTLSKLESYRKHIEKSIPKPDVILNAFGKNTILACHLSKVWNIPLCIFLHDVWQVWAKTNLDRRMTEQIARNILTHASRVWPVSQEMVDFYNLDNATILHSIPEGKNEFVCWKDSFDRPVIFSAGSFRPHQIAQFRRISKCLEDVRGKLCLISNQKDVLKRELSDCDNIEFLDSFKYNIEALEFVKKNASAFLVPWSCSKYWGKLSFPSRFIEFAQLGLPVILFSTEDCALGSWAKKNQWKLFTSGQEISKIISALSKRKDWEFSALQSRKVARGEFNPVNIHRTFESELEFISQDR